MPASVASEVFGAAAAAHSPADSDSLSEVGPAFAQVLRDVGPPAVDTATDGETDEDAIHVSLGEMALSYFDPSEEDSSASPSAAAASLPAAATAAAGAATAAAAGPSGQPPGPATAVCGLCGSLIFRDDYVRHTEICATAGPEGPPGAAAPTLRCGFCYRILPRLHDFLLHIRRCPQASPASAAAAAAAAAAPVHRPSRRPRSPSPQSRLQAGKCVEFASECIREGGQLRRKGPERHSSPAAAATRRAASPACSSPSPPRRSSRAPTPQSREASGVRGTKKKMPPSRLRSAVAAVHKGICAALPPSLPPSRPPISIPAQGLHLFGLRATKGRFANAFHRFLAQHRDSSPAAGSVSLFLLIGGGGPLPFSLHPDISSVDQLAEVIERWMAGFGRPPHLLCSTAVQRFIPVLQGALHASFARRRRRLEATAKLPLLPGGFEWNAQSQGVRAIFAHVDVHGPPPLPQSRRLLTRAAEDALNSRTGDACVAVRDLATGARLSAAAAAKLAAVVVAAGSFAGKNPPLILEGADVLRQAPFFTPITQFVNEVTDTERTEAFRGVQQRQVSCTHCKRDSHHSADCFSPERKTKRSHSSVIAPTDPIPLSPSAPRQQGKGGKGGRSITALGLRRHLVSQDAVVAPLPPAARPPAPAGGRIRPARNIRRRRSESIALRRIQSAVAHQRMSGLPPAQLPSPRALSLSPPTARAAHRLQADRPLHLRPSRRRKERERARAPSPSPPRAAASPPQGFGPEAPICDGRRYIETYAYRESIAGGNDFLPPSRLVNGESVNNRHFVVLDLGSNVSQLPASYIDDLNACLGSPGISFKWRPGRVLMAHFSLFLPAGGRISIEAEVVPSAADRRILIGGSDIIRNLVYFHRSQPRVWVGHARPGGTLVQVQSLPGDAPPPPPPGVPPQNLVKRR